VSDPEGNRPEFDDLDLPSDETLPSGDEASASGSEDETMGLDPGALGDAPAGGGFDDLPEAPAAESEPGAEPDEPKKKRKEKVAKEGPGLLGGLTTTSPYVVMLGISLVALLIAILCLVAEWGRYDYQRKPSQGVPAPAAQQASSTTATA
jgi:hypothetical protein